MKQVIGAFGILFILMINIFMMEHMLMIGGIHVRAGSLERHIQSSQLNFCYGHLRQHM